MQIIKGGIADKNGAKCELNPDSLVRRFAKKPKAFASEMYKYYKENLA